MRVIFLIASLTFGLGANAADSFVADFICEPVTDAGERAQCVERALVAPKQERATVTEKSGLVSMIWPFGWWAVYYAFGLLIGRYIYRDARARDWVFLGIRPVWWAVLALFEPPFGLLVYWALHYSKFAQSYQEATARPSAPNA